MSAIQQVFRKLRSSGSTAFIPFLTAGDPDLELTAEATLGLSRAGCHLIELGFPYSDPIADGPVIQASYSRALAAGATPERVLGMVAELVRGGVTAPLVGMVSYSIVARLGERAFVERAVEAGLAGAIVPDLPLEELDSLDAVCRARDFDLILLVARTTPRDRAARIADRSRGFVYYVAVVGTTGERQRHDDQLAADVAWLKSVTDVPVCVGFGIGQPEQARPLVGIADGIIVGSALVRRMAGAAATADLSVRRAVVADVVTTAQGFLQAIAAASPTPQSIRRS
jgi:tryptophan synthase alpha chain